MIIGLMRAMDAPPTVDGLPVRLQFAPSPEALLTDFLIGACDWVLVSGDSHKAQQITLEIAGPCRFRPLAAVCELDTKRGTLSFISTGRAVSNVLPLWQSIQMPSIEALRHVWRSAWCRQIAVSALHRDHAADQIALVTRSLAIALSAPRTADIPAALSIPARTLSRHLQNVGLRGPKRILMAARAFDAWERSRLGTVTLEGIALDLHYAGLSTLRRLLHTVAGVSARELATLNDTKLLARLAESLKRSPSVQKHEIAARMA